MKVTVFVEVIVGVREWRRVEETKQLNNQKHLSSYVEFSGKKKNNSRVIGWETSLVIYNSTRRKESVTCVYHR